jgi:hypothetical protein
MYVSDIPAGKLHHGCLATVRSVGRNKDLRSSGLRLVECCCEIWHLVAGSFKSVGIWEVAIGHQYSYLTEHGLDTDTAIALAWAADLYPGSPRVVREDFAMTKGEEAPDKCRRPVC